MTKKRKVAVALASMLGAVIFAVTVIGSVAAAPRTSIISASYPADFSKDDILVGASHNIFVGKVLSQSGAKKLGSTPEAQFAVEVIRNIKGELSGEVTVNQLGGFEDGTLYMFERDLPFVTNTDSDTDYMLQPGQMYVLSTRYNADEHWYTLNTFPTARKLIRMNAELPTPAILSLIDHDQRVLELRGAYPHEAPLLADVANENARNSFAALPASEKAKMVSGGE